MGLEGKHNTHLDIIKGIKIDLFGVGGRETVKETYDGQKQNHSRIRA